MGGAAEAGVRAGGYRIEPETLEGSVDLLRAREGERARGVLAGAEPVPRRAVFVSRLLDRRGTSIGAPMVRRYVVAGFAYGEDLVSFEETVSHAVEFPHGPDSSEARRERQVEVYERFRDELRGRIAAVGLEGHVPVLDGHLRHAQGRD